MKKVVYILAFGLFMFLTWGIDQLLPVSFCGAAGFVLIIAFLLFGQSFLKKIRNN